MAESVRILVWSDYVCPFCYLELPVLDRLREELGEAVSIEWRAFELRPEPAPTLDPNGEYLHRVWNASVYPMAVERGMTLRLPPVQPRSRRALEAAEFAREAGRYEVMHHALFAAFFEEGRDIGEMGVLLGIAGALGLDRNALQAALQDGRHTAKVLEDQRLAHEVGISGVPGMVITAGEQGYLMSGAQPYDAVRQAVAQAAQLVPAPFERATYS